MNVPQQESGPAQRRAVLVVASCSPEHLSRADHVIQSSIARGVPVRYAISHRQALVRTQLEGRGAELRVQPRRLLAIPRWLRSLRRERFTTTVVLFTGDRWYRRLKTVGLILAFPNGLILNENGDYCRPTPSKLYLHLAWRLAQRRVRYGGLLRSAWRLFRRDGPGALLRRLSTRAQSRGRLTAVLRLISSVRRLRRISLPHAEEPEVSIIIPAHNQWHFTHSCIDSIVQHTSTVAYEVILVDNASTDRTRTIESSTSGLQVLRFPENRGFVEACNSGAQIARGDKIVFLNNDVSVTSGWLEALIAVTRTRANWGAVGAKLLFPNGKLQEAGGIVWRDGSAWNYGRFDDPERPEYNYVREVDYCSAAALLVRREAFEKVGGLDPAYSPGYWEDTDLCFALRDAGYSVWYQPASVVFHYEGASSGTDEAMGMKRFQRLNSDYFRIKWAEQLSRQCEFQLASLFRARDRKAGRTVLVFDHYVPTPDRDAGSALMYWFLKSVLDLGYRVVFWPQNLFRSLGYTASLQQDGIEVLYGRVAIKDFLESFGHFIDFAIAYRSAVAIEYLPLTRPFVYAQAYIAVDLEHLREERRLDAEGHGGSKVAFLRAREAQLVELVDCIGVHSPVEQDILKREFGARCIVHLPLPIPPMPPTSTPLEERDGLLFVGSTHPPNVDAIRHFIRYVFPSIRKRNPATRLWIVGDVCAKVTSLGREPGVHLVGHARNLQPWFERARVFVAPLRYGAGIKGKVLGAMSAGVPVVTTTIGAEGIGLESGLSAFIEDSDEGFADAVHRLTTDRELWWRIRQTAREIVEGELSFERFQASVADLMKRLACAEGSASAKSRRALK